MNRTERGNVADGNATRSPIPTVDVVMPVYNGAAFLEEQVRSILSQIDVTVRLIAVDDASSDGSFALLNRLAAEDARVSVFQNPKNLGLMRSLSRLLREVTAQYFALADQDDIWDSTKLARSIETLLSRKATLVYSDVRLIDAAGNFLKDRYLAPAGMRPLEGRDPVPFIFRNPAIGHTLVGTADVARAVGEIDPCLIAHEIWIVATACRFGQVVFLDAPLGSYRQHASNVVGARRDALYRLSRLFGPDGTLWRRQQTRIRAIQVLSCFYPALVPIAAAQKGHALHRFLGLPYFAMLMFRLAPRIGLLPALTEIALYPFAGNPPVCGTASLNARSS